MSLKGVTVSSSYFTATNGVYTDFMVEEMKKIPREKIPPTTTQAESTKRILARDPSQDEAWFNRPNPSNWKAVPDAKTQEEAVGMRSLTPDEYNTEESRRRSSKNTLGDAVSLGARSLSEDAIERAIHAFTYSTPTELSSAEMVKLKQLSPYEKLPTIKEKPVKEKDKFWVLATWISGIGAAASIGATAYMVWRVLH